MTKVFLRFFLIFSVAYLVLFFLTSLPGPKETISSMYKEMANTFIPPFLGKAAIQFEQNPGIPDDPDRIRVRFQSHQVVEEQKQLAKGKGLKTIDVNFKSYNVFLFEFFIFPLLYFSALVIAAPVNWKRKGMALLIGLVLLHIFMLFKGYFITLYHLQVNQILGYQMGEFAAGVIKKVQLAFNNITTAFITATLIWAITVFRKDDWKKITTPLEGKAKRSRKA
jgi:hypothetical protein